MVKPYIINAYKPAGMGSLDVVKVFKKHLPKPYGKIGHFGTLDPFAEGVLLIGVGGAMKVNDYLHDWYPKTYEAVGILGVKTPSGDVTCEQRLWEKDDADDSLRFLDLGDLKEKLEKKFTGPYSQVPPYYSATKFEGRKLHEWAREGVLIDKPPVERFIHKIEILDVKFPEITFRVSVSSGTYIRVLFEDMAKELGTIGVLKQLKRTQVAGATIEEALRNDKWPEATNWSWELALPVDKLIALDEVVLGEKNTKLFCNGVRLRTEQLDGYSPRNGQYLWVKSPAGKVLGMARIQNDVMVSKINLFGK